MTNVSSFLEDSFEGYSYYLKASGLNIRSKDQLQSFIDSFRSRITLTTKALGALSKASMGLVCDASQGIRNACTEMLSACCIHHIQSPQHLQVLSDILFQPMIGYQKNAPVSTIMAEIMRFNALSTGGSSTEVQRLKSLVLSIQAAVNSGLIPNVDPHPPTALPPQQQLLSQPLPAQGLLGYSRDKAHSVSSRVKRAGRQEVSTNTGVAYSPNNNAHHQAACR